MNQLETNTSAGKMATDFYLSTNKAFGLPYHLRCQTSDNGNRQHYQIDLQKIAECLNSGVLFMLAFINADDLDTFFQESDNYYRTKKLSIIERTLTEYILFQHKTIQLNFAIRTWVSLQNEKELFDLLGLKIAVEQGQTEEKANHVVYLTLDYGELKKRNPLWIENLEILKGLFQEKKELSNYMGNFRYYRILHPLNKE